MDTVWRARQPVRFWSVAAFGPWMPRTTRISRLTTQTLHDKIQPLSEFGGALIPNPKEPGQIDITVAGHTKPGRKKFAHQHVRLGHMDGETPLIVLIGMLILLFFSPFIALDIEDWFEHLGHVKPVEKPSVNNLAVPARPEYPGYYARFYIRAKGKATGGSSGRLESEYTRSITFTYEHIHLVTLADEKEIPAAIKAESYTFKGGTGNPAAFAEVVDEGDPGLSEKVNGLADSVVDPVSTSTAGGLSDAGKGRAGRLKPYIIYGEVDISCGPLIKRDSGYAQAYVSDQDIAKLDLDFSQQGPRGPPSTEFMLSLGQNKLIRTVYVVGRVKSFSGPDQFHRSFMKTSVIDLGPSKRELKVFHDQGQEWQVMTSYLAAKYEVDLGSLRTFAGREVGIYDGEVHRSPTPEEVEEANRDEQARKEKERIREETERAERAERFEVP